MNVLGLDVQAEPKGRGQWRFYPIGDLHLDSVTCDRERLAEYIDMIAADPFAMYVVVGDLVDGTTPSHRFFEAATVRPDVVQNMAEYIDAMILELQTVFEPLKGTPGVFIRGNHDRRRGGTLYSGIVPAIARATGALYGGDECLVRVRTKREASDGDKVMTQNWTVHAFHGAGGGMYPGGKVNRFQNTVGQLAEADIYVRGHVHDSDVRIMPIYSVSNRGKVRLQQRPRAFVTAPDFSPGRTENRTNYASRKGYPPNDEGIIFLHCENGRTGKKPKQIFREEFRG